MGQEKPEEITAEEMKVYIDSQPDQDIQAALERFLTEHQARMRQASEIERGKMAEILRTHGMDHLIEVIDPAVEKMIQGMEAIYDDVTVRGDRIEPKIAEALARAEALNISEQEWEKFRLKLIRKFESTLQDHTKIPLTLETFFRKLQGFGVSPEKLEKLREKLIGKWEVFLGNMIDDPRVDPDRIKLRIQEAQTMYGIPASALDPFRARLDGRALTFVKMLFNDPQNNAPALTAALNDASKAEVGESELAPLRIILADKWEAHLEAKFETSKDLSERRELIYLAKRGGLSEDRLKKFRDRTR